MNNSFLMEWLVAKKLVTLEGDEVVAKPGLLYAFEVLCVIYYCVLDQDGKLHFFQNHPSGEYRLTVQYGDANTEIARMVLGEACFLCWCDSEGMRYITPEGTEQAEKHIERLKKMKQEGEDVQLEQFYDWPIHPLRQILPLSI